MLKDPELGLPEEQEAPAQALAVGMRVRVKAMGITGELMALQGEEAEVAISGKRLRVPQAELVALLTATPGGRRSRGSARSSTGRRRDPSGPGGPSGSSDRIPRGRRASSPSRSPPR